MQVLGFDPVIITIAICVIGVSFQIITGMTGKKWSEFNPMLAMTTFMIGMVTSVGLVAPVIDALPNNLDSTLQLAAVFGQIGLVMGIDGATRKGHKIAQKITNNNSIQSDDIEPIDSSDDLPPGKETTEKTQ